MSGFSFGFNSDDIEEDGSDSIDSDEVGHAGSKSPNVSHGLAEANLHTLDEMSPGSTPISVIGACRLSDALVAAKISMAKPERTVIATLPSSISYSMHSISENPLLRLPRRELFDIRAQLLAETDISDVKSISLAEGLTSGDIQPRRYEGGFKTWECSIDLARLLVLEESAGSKHDWVNIVEIGAGTAVPSCTMLYCMLKRYAAGTGLSVDSEQRKTLVMADYNYHVLTHASLPNLILTFAYVKSLSSTAANYAFPEQDELELTESLLSEFQQWLERKGLRIYGLSGAWGSRFSEIMGQIIDNQNTLILASETIYQPDSLSAFTEVLLDLLESNDQRPSVRRALVAAKKVYFGVGGGVDEFLSVLKAAGGHASVEWDAGSAGVGRLILNVCPK